MNFESLLKAPSFVINLSRRPDRYSHTLSELQKAGFMDIRRFDAVDGSDATVLEEAWSATIPRPVINLHYDAEFNTYKGKQGIFLSQVRLWKHIIDMKLPYACIFEDDISFHAQWSALAPLYFTKTPIDWDVLFMGSQMEFKSTAHIERGPVFCLHAYMVTLEGARKLYQLVMDQAYTSGVYTIDTMLKVHMETRSPSFSWYVWNGKPFHDPKCEMAKGWTKRNQGLVFQEEHFGSDVREY